MVHSRRGPGLGAGLQKLSCVALVVSVVLLGCGVSGALATAGGLDLTFSGDGKQITGFGGTDRANAVAIQSNGKIVVVGSPTRWRFRATARSWSLDHPTPWAPRTLR
ncbi:MAG: hypothetical protein HYZ72_01630 [Deltaproteobacteria bacterium]|nr:hypothetical protein [Deltaproteobacteria bacterium]